MPICSALKLDGAPCTHHSHRAHDDTHPAHLQFCGTHRNTYMRTVATIGGTHHTEGRCMETARGRTPAGLTVLRWCPNAAEVGHHHCGTHQQRIDARVAHAANPNNPRQIARALLTAFQEQVPIPNWQAVAQVMHGMADVPAEVRLLVARQYFDRTAAGRPRWQFGLYWRWLDDGGAGPLPDFDALAAPPPPAPVVRPLGALARDSQNVHTRAVTDQTNAATEKLSTVKVPPTQQTEKAMAVIWLGKLDVPYSTFMRVAGDVNRWFNTKDCRAVDDNLYRKLLRGLVAIISGESDDERKTEMYRRLWEECLEATGMCCEGHISRLCNVLVGFDDAFKTPVAFGEILQSKMAAIAGMDLSEEEKRRQATAFFDEYGTPAEERVAWLEAF